MTRFKQWQFEQQGAKLTQSAWALQAQIAQEIAPKVAQKRAAYEDGFGGLDNRQQVSSTTESMKRPAPPPINCDLDTLSDREGEAEKAALDKLNNIPNRLRTRLDDQLRPRLRYLQSL